MEWSIERGELANGRDEHDGLLVMRPNAGITLGEFDGQICPEFYGGAQQLGSEIRIIQPRMTRRVPVVAHPRSDPRYFFALKPPIR
jgi:hypothetical protein